MLPPKNSTSPGASSTGTGLIPAGGRTKCVVKLSSGSATSGHATSIVCVPGQTYRPPFSGTERSTAVQAAMQVYGRTRR